MLIEIRCDHFKNKTLEFHEGLNVVVGDDNAANSIGKSSLLMIIDFVFGGNSFLVHNDDVVKQYGPHTYSFCLFINGRKYFYSRETSKPKTVNVCNGNYNVEQEITLEEYTKFLKEAYIPDLEALTFRAVSGLFARVWGKDNLDVKNPLHQTPKAKGEDVIDFLLKLFNEHESAVEIKLNLKKIQKNRDALKIAFNNGLIPQINNTIFKKNEELLKEYNEEVESIKKDLAKFAMNLSELTNKEVLELKIKKDELLAVRLHLESSLRRINSNLKANKRKLKQRFEGLERYFPDLDVSRLEEIESFHDKIKTILDEEFTSARNKLETNLSMVNSQIETIDSEMKKVLSKVKDPTSIIDRVAKVNSALQRAQAENSYYEKKKGLDTKAKELEGEIAQKKIVVLKDVENKINEKIKLLVEEIYGPNRKSPELKLEEKKYDFKIADETGTGKAFSNLIIFDLSIFEMTSVPFLIHDSVLFKNVENEAIANIIKKYDSYSKQTFISIDEIEKFGPQTANILDKKKVIKLSSDDQLFTKDWRSKK